MLRYWTAVKNVEEVTTKSNFIRCIRKLGMATPVYFIRCIQKLGMATPIYLMRCIRKLGMATPVYFLNCMLHITNQSVLADC